MPSPQQTQPNPPVGPLNQAIQLAKTGHKAEACQQLRRLVAHQPVNQAAWLWLSAVAADRAEAEAALARARRINPTHQALPRAEQWLAKRFASGSSPTRKMPILPSPGLPAVPAPRQRATGWSHRLTTMALWIVIAAVMVGLVVFFLGMALEVRATSAGNVVAPVGPGQSQQLELAWQARDWPQVITLLETIKDRPDLAPVITGKLAYAYLQHGLSLRYQGRIEEALTRFKSALALAPEDLRTQQELTLAADYVAGAEAYQAGRWETTITTLERIYHLEPAYPHVNDMLYSAYYNHGLALKAAGAFSPARSAFEAALALRPDLAEPRVQVTEIEYALAPETLPTVPVGAPLEDRLILVGIAEQRMQVYEEGRQIFDFVVSTGEPGSDTAIGEFEILNKIEVAYASTWNLDMPYWLGIYWAGSLQNGIHSLPIVKHTGYKLWDGYLGQRVSYGCVILSDEDAAKLYEWAEVGVKVKIVPSLSAWSAAN